MDILSDFERRLKRIESIVFHNDIPSDESKNGGMMKKSCKIVYEKTALLSLRAELLSLNHLKRPLCLQDYNPRKITPLVSTPSRIVTVVPIESGLPPHHNKKISPSHIVYSDKEGHKGHALMESDLQPHHNKKISPSHIMYSDKEGPTKRIQPPPPLSRIEEKSSKEKLKKDVFITRDEGKVEVQYGLIVRSPDN
jgi:hypothetical protein